jgi:hypothetical protein
LVDISYLYHKARKCRVIHKIFSADSLLFKAKYNNFCRIAIGNLFFFHWQHKRSKKRPWHYKSQSIPQIFKTVVVLSIIPNPSPVVHEGCWSGGELLTRTLVGLFTITPSAVVTPSASTDSISAIHNVSTACDKE